MKLKSIFLAAVALMLFASCTKERGGFGGSGGLIPEGKRIEKMYSVYDNGSSRSISTVFFEWGADGLLQKASMYYNNENEPEDEWLFSYEGINAKEITRFDYNSAREYKYVFTYDGDNPTRMDYYRDNVFKESIYISCNEEGQITSIVMDDGNFTLTFVWRDGNLVREDEHDNSYDSYRTYRYDSNRNPFATMPKAFMLMTDDDFTMMSSNNVTKCTWSSGDELTCSYVYDGEYPSKRIYEDQSVLYFKYTDGTGSSPSF